MMAWTRLAEMTRVRKSGWALNRFGRLSHPDVLMDRMQGMREREASEMVLMLLASAAESHESPALA